MPDDLRLRQSPAPLQRLRRSTLLVAALAVLALVGLLAYAKTQIPPVASWMAREQAPAPAPVSMPESLKAVERPYQELIPKPKPPIAEPIPKPAPPLPPIAAPLPPPPVQAQADPMPAFLELMKKQQDLSEKVATQPPPPIQAQTPPPQEPKKPARQAWRIKPVDISIRKDGEKAKEGEVSKGEREAVGKKGEAEKLISAAIWSRPAKPWATLYRSQQLAGKTLNAINSDIPGQVRIELTIPVFDKFGYDYEILPKGSLIIAQQEGKPEFGQSRLPLKLLQIELPTSEIITLKAAVGDDKGNGVGGKVNSHLSKLLLASGINAMLSLGSNSLAGTPSSFYANPAQQTARDVSQSVSNDTKKIVDAQLKVPPTIEIKVGTIVSIGLEENVQFAKKAVVVR